MQVWVDIVGLVEYPPKDSHPSQCYLDWAAQRRVSLFMQWMTLLLRSVHQPCSCIVTDQSPVDDTAEQCVALSEDTLTLCDVDWRRVCMYVCVSVRHGAHDMSQCRWHCSVRSSARRRPAVQHIHNWRRCVTLFLCIMRTNWVRA